MNSNASCTPCSCSLAVLNPRVGHTMDVLSPFISVLCHSDWLFHGESCPRLDVVHSGRAWPSSPACTWHCALPLSPDNSLVSSWCDHSMLASLLWRCLTVPSLLQLCKELTRFLSTKPAESFSVLSSQRLDHSAQKCYSPDHHWTVSSIRQCYKRQRC